MKLRSGRHQKPKKGRVVTNKLYLNYYLFLNSLAVTKTLQNQKNEKQLPKRTKSPSYLQTRKTQSSQQSTLTNQTNSSDEELNDIYSDIKNPASYSSNVKAFVNQKTSISLHKRRIKNFVRRKIIVPG